jgi:hypothetical protein
MNPPLLIALPLHESLRKCTGRGTIPLGFNRDWRQVPSPSAIRRFSLKPTPRPTGPLLPPLGVIATSSAFLRGRKNVDIPNAFLNKAVEPTAEEVSAALGTTAEVWKQLVDWLMEQGVADREWKSVSPKYGWSMRLKSKKRTIVYLSPCDGCFRVAFVLGDKAMAAARQSDLSKGVLKLLDEATRYAEGTGVRLLVKGTKDLAAVRKLAVIKLAN